MVVVAAAVASHQVPGHQAQNLHPPSQVPVQVPYIIPRRYVMTNSTGGKQNFIDLTQLTNIHILLLLATAKSLAAMVERLPELSSVCINLPIFFCLPSVKTFQRFYCRSTRGRSLVLLSLLET